MGHGPAIDRSRPRTVFRANDTGDCVSGIRGRGHTCNRYTDQCQIRSMKRYLIMEKIMRLTRILFMAAVMVACATQSLPAWAQSAELINAFKQLQTLKKTGELR